MTRGLLGLLGGWVLWRLFGPWRAPTYPEPQHKPLHLPGRTVFVGEREYFVREAGPADAPPVLLIPGWGADSLLNWQESIPLLADRFRVVAVDPLNQGKSDRVWEPYRIEVAADRLAELMEALGVARAAVAGYSMGGMVALTLARRHPDRVERLVLAATAAWVPLRARRLRRLAFLAGRGVERLSRVEASRLRTRYLRRVGAIGPSQARWAWEHFMSRDPGLFYEAGLAAIDFDARPWLGEVGHPALVVIPTEDLLIPPSAQYALAAALVDARVAELVGAGHEACLTHAEHIAKEILEFL